jgi:hypothetical protein
MAGSDNLRKICVALKRTGILWDHVRLEMFYRGSRLAGSDIEALRSLTTRKLHLFNVAEVPLAVAEVVKDLEISESSEMIKIDDWSRLEMSSLYLGQLSNLENMCAFPLNLQDLTLTSCGSSRFPPALPKLPGTLRRFVLRGCNVRLHLSHIECLANLEDLCLEGNGVLFYTDLEGASVWFYTPDDKKGPLVLRLQTKRLRCLKIIGMPFESFSVEAPLLECLVIAHCWFLKHIPLVLGENLREFTLKRCPRVKRLPRLQTTRPAIYTLDPAFLGKAPDSEQPEGKPNADRWNWCTIFNFQVPDPDVRVVHRPVARLLMFVLILAGRRRGMQLPPPELWELIENEFVGTSIQL